MSRAGGDAGSGRAGTVWFAVVAITIGLATVLCGPPADAQPGGAGASQSGERDFDIPAQPLADALIQFGRQAGLQVSADTALARDLRSAPVRGRMPWQQALATLLSGSGLTWRLNGSMVALEKPAPAGGPGGATRLDPVVVEGQSGPRQAEIGNLPRPYAGGQVARGGKVGLLGNRDFMATPFNQTSYTSRLIQDQQARTLADVLNNDPSVRNDFPGGSGIDQATIRGFLAGNQDIAFGGLYGVAPTSNGMMAVESIERVEVLKGPNALLNGMVPFGSIGGSINVVPKRAGALPVTQFTPSFYADVQPGGHFDIGRRFGPDGSFGVRFNGAYRYGPTAIDRQSQETRVTALGVDFRGESVRLSADLGYQYIYTDVVRPPLQVAAGVPVPKVPSSKSNYSQPWVFQESQNIYGALRGEVDIAANWTAFAAVGGGLFRFKAQQENPTVRDTLGTITPIPAAVRIREDTATVEMGLRGSVTTGFMRHDIALTNTLFWKETGAAFSLGTFPASNLYHPVFAPRPSFGNLPDPGDAPRTSRQVLSSLAFADTVSILDERVQLTLGLRRQRVRADNFDSATGNKTSGYDKSAWTPAVGLVVRPLPYLSLYANYIEGLSQGPTAPAGTINAGQVFPPFVSKQYEAGVKIDFGRIATTLSAFQITQPSSFTNPATNAFGVDGEQRNRGLELAAFGEVSDGIRLLGGVSLIDSKLTRTQVPANKGNRGIGVPLLQANLGGEWDVPFLPGLTLSARAIYTSSQYLDAANAQRLPSWFRFDLGARYVIETAGTPIIVRASLENVFNAHYWASASRGFLGLSTPRTFLLSTTFSF